jgi:23S rRNA (uracil747-C5)-methyltransferase
VKKINDALPVIKNFITLSKLTPYQIGTKTGELKGLILFHSETSDSTYVRFILRSKESIDRIKKHSPFLISSLQNIKAISANIQPIPHAILEGDEEVFISENHFIDHQIHSVHLSLHPKAFVQTNQAMASNLYSTAAQWIKDSGKKDFMELYCGQGAFSFMAAPYVNKAMGIEINSEAVQIANLTAKKNNLPHLTFKNSDASDVLNDIQNFKPEIILVNPPRRGLGATCDLLIKTKPSSLIYSSCHSESLVEDLKKLIPYYNITKIKIFDMFPHTKHFETLVELNSKV